MDPLPLYNSRYHAADKYLSNETQTNSIRLLFNFYENYTKLENVTYEEEYDYIFDNLVVRYIFILLYSIVFCGCVSGNLMVILLVLLTRRLKSTTNFFLANLAFADLCVGVFCIFQNLAFYLITTWIFGDFLCKMTQFIYGLSCTASIFILVVISVERYLAIIHPMQCKRILTRNRLWIIMAFVWIISIAYATPRFIISHTITNPLSGTSEVICVMSRVRYNSKVFDIINFILLYLIPLGVMSVLYSFIAVRLWNSELNCTSTCKWSRNISPAITSSKANTMESTSTTSFVYESPNGNYIVHRTTCSATHSKPPSQYHVYHCPRNMGNRCGIRHRSSNQILGARRRVIRMLTLLVLAFAVCNLPFHARKMWQYWSTQYDGSSAFCSLFTPITFICTYSNSLINPLLYAFLSKNFQRSIRELLTCGLKRRKNMKQVSFKQKFRRSLTRSSVTK